LDKPLLSERNRMGFPYSRMDDIRFKCELANDRPLKGLASALTATQARLLVRINHGGLAPEPAACVAWVLKLPYTLTSENAQHCLPAAHCIRATFFGKVDDLQFAPLRGMS
jgi:hypothetical protein